MGDVHSHCKHHHPHVGSFDHGSCGRGPVQAPDDMSTGQYLRTFASKGMGRGRRTTILLGNEGCRAHNPTLLRDTVNTDGTACLTCTQHDCMISWVPSRLESMQPPSSRKRRWVAESCSKGPLRLVYTGMCVYIYICIYIYIY